MIKNEIDEFRNKVLDKIIEEEKQKEIEQKKLERDCFHVYNIIEDREPLNYDERVCSKCGHVKRRNVYKRKPVRSGNKDCIIL